MAEGDVIGGISSLASGGSMDIRPPAGDEWIIHNLYFSNTIELSFYDGSNNLIFGHYNFQGLAPWLCRHLTNSRYYRIKALKTGTTLAGYDGVETK
jgi:hypothetical protein